MDVPPCPPSATAPARGLIPVSTAVDLPAQINKLHTALIGQGLAPTRNYNGALYSILALAPNVTANIRAESVRKSLHGGSVQLITLITIGIRA